MPPCWSGYPPSIALRSTPLLPAGGWHLADGEGGAGALAVFFWSCLSTCVECDAYVRCFYPCALGATAARMARACPGSPALWLLSLWMLLLLWVYWSSLSCPNGPSSAVPAVVAYAITTERQRWGELRHTPCDGLELPAAASIGVFEGRTVPLLRTLGHREELATLANQ